MNVSSSSFFLLVKFYLKALPFQPFRIKETSDDVDLIISGRGKVSDYLLWLAYFILQNLPY